MPARADDKHRIVIVGGGAGGLELATRLGGKLGKRGRAEIILVDKAFTHLWKPLLHEVAAGTLDSHEDELEYLAQARWHHFRFRIGEMDSLDRQAREISLKPIHDDDGEEIIPRRTIGFDTLILAVGSVSNDFGIPTIREHCAYIDSRPEADRFHAQLMQNYLRAQTRSDDNPNALNVVIVGAGATGVELAAELQHTAGELVAYGFDWIEPGDVKVTLIEAADRILPALPPRIAAATEQQLRSIGVQVYTGRRVAQATDDHVETDDGLVIPARMKVWAAGIMGPDFLKEIDGLETNSRNQLVVTSTLQTTRDPNIFAFGDCANAPQSPGDDTPVPPRAQAAHQQATMLYKSMQRRLRGHPLPQFTYRDYGSLISLSRFGTVGNLMGNLAGDITLEGRFARLAYLSLYRMHQVALHGTIRTCLIVIADWLTRARKPRLKLH